MDKQPEALRLAEAVERCVKQIDAEDDVVLIARWYAVDAAAELRRLHAANLDCVAWYEAIKAERDELLEALKDVRAAIYVDDNGHLRLTRSFDESVIDAAIAKAGETK